MDGSLVSWVQGEAWCRAGWWRCPLSSERPPCRRDGQILGGRAGGWQRRATRGALGWKRRNLAMIFGCHGIDAMNGSDGESVSCDFFSMLTGEVSSVQF